MGGGRRRALARCRSPSSQRRSTGAVRSSRAPRASARVTQVAGSHRRMHSPCSSCALDRASGCHGPLAGDGSALAPRGERRPCRPLEPGSWISRGRRRVERVRTRSARVGDSSTGPRCAVSRAALVVRGPPSRVPRPPDRVCQYGTVSPRAALTSPCPAMTRSRAPSMDDDPDASASPAAAWNDSLHTCTPDLLHATSADSHLGFA